MNIVYFIVWGGIKEGRMRGVWQRKRGLPQTET